jgi:CMP-N-acetylneuraminic acid synthetase
MFTAIIPVKKNSGRLPGKNLKIFGKENLLTRKIRQLKESKIADRIIVSSDCTKMLQVAKDANVNAIIRPTCYADESKPATEFFPYLASLIPEGHFIYSCVTSPHFDAKLMIEAKNKYLEAINDGYDSLITVYKFQHFLMDKKGPLNFGFGAEHKNSEDLPELDLFTNGIVISPISSVKKWRYHFGPKAYRFEVDQKASNDIDTKLDYLTALAWEQ